MIRLGTSLTRFFSPKAIRYMALTKNFLCNSRVPAEKHVIDTGFCTFSCGVVVSTSFKLTI